MHTKLIKSGSKQKNPADTNHAHHRQKQSITRLVPRKAAVLVLVGLVQWAYASEPTYATTCRPMTEGNGGCETHIDYDKIIKAIGKSKAYSGYVELGVTLTCWDLDSDAGLRRGGEIEGRTTYANRDLLLTAENYPTQTDVDIIKVPTKQQFHTKALANRGITLLLTCYGYKEMSYSWTAKQVKVLNWHRSE